MPVIGGGRTGGGNEFQGQGRGGGTPVEISLFPPVENMSVMKNSFEEQGEGVLAR
jgi:hypothetical protein